MALDNNDRRGVWKSGRGKGRPVPKGRQVEDAALAEIQALLGDRERRRDLLIEHLHLIQDRHGHLSAPPPARARLEMQLPMAEVWEVASFYAHFDLVREGEAAPRLTIRVCDSLSCELAGAQALKAALEAGHDPAQRPRAARALHGPLRHRAGGRGRAPPCRSCHARKRCRGDRLGRLSIRSSPTTRGSTPIAPAAATTGLWSCARTATGRRCRTGPRLGPARAGRRGLSDRPEMGLRARRPGPRYLAVNGDEGEPGTFKDRWYLEREPHLMLEGMLIAAWAVEAARCFIYMRDEYPAVLEILRREIAALEAAGIVAPGYIDLRRGAGAYICGEESAMLESIEGKRGLPRHRPPYVAQVGLWGRPTLVHNVETLHWVARVVREGPEVLSATEKNGRKGLRSYSVSGRVAKPGVYLLPAGSTIRDVIDAAGGMAEGHAFKAYQPGGPSSGLLPATLDDVPLDFDTLQPHGSFIGSAAVVVLSDKDSARDAALNMLRFFEDESCGQCTPCRVGLREGGEADAGRALGPRCWRSFARRWPMPRSAGWARRRPTRSC
jgi:formate dehydrogenase beta subunit